RFWRDPDSAPFDAARGVSSASRGTIRAKSLAARAPPALRGPFILGGRNMSMGTSTALDVLVSTDWVKQHLGDATIRVVEVDVDTAAYDQGHVPGSLGWNWTTELCDTVIRDIVPKDKLESLLGRSGITPQTTIVLYGDNNNWFAAWAFWQLKVYGHQDVRIMDGGRKKGPPQERKLETTPAKPAAAAYAAKDPDL